MIMLETYQCCKTTLSAASHCPTAADREKRSVQEKTPSPDPVKGSRQPEIKSVPLDSKASKEKAIRIMKSGLLPGTEFCFPITGYSMYPLILPGTKVILSTRITRILIGDIIAVTDHQQSAIMAHRVIFVRKKRGKPVLFFTKGDGNRAFDKAICPDYILGKIVALKKNNTLINFSKPSWRIAGFLISLISGIFGTLDRWIDSYSGKTKIGFRSRKLLFFIYRIFLYTIVLPCV